MGDTLTTLGCRRRNVLTTQLRGGCALSVNRDIGELVSEAYTAYERAFKSHYLGEWVNADVAVSDRMCDLMSDAMIVAFYRHFGTIPTDEQFTHDQLDWIEGFETARLADMRDHDLWVSGKARESRLVGHLARWLSENAPGVRHILGGW